MKKTLDVIDTVIRWLEDLVCGSTMAALVLIATASVIGRYIFKVGFLWADEVDQALLVALGMFGSARAVRTNGHTEFTALVNKPKSRGVRIALRALFLAITIVFLVLLLVWTAQYTANGTMLSTTLRIPRMYYYMSIPIGFALMIYEYLRAAKHRVMDDPVPDEE